MQRPVAVLDPIRQNADRDSVIRRGHRLRDVVSRVDAFHPQTGLRRSNSIDLAVQDAAERVAGFERRELDAR